MKQKNAVTPLSLGTDSLSSLLARYAIPAIIAMTSSSLYNIIDSIFIGHGVGALAISGLALTMPLMNLSSAFGSMVGVGAAAIISIRLGEGNRAAAEKTLGNVVLLNLLIGLLMMIISILFLDPILYYFGASDQTIGYARDFMQIILAGSVVTHMYLGLNEVLRASGYPQKAMMIMLTAVVVNCALNPLFIFVFGWGIRGSALATVIAQMTALSISLRHFSRPDSFLHFKHGIFRLRKKIVQGILSIGTAPFLLHLCASIVVIFVNKALQSNGGDLYIGAYGVINRVVL
ncbi:MAG: polysaccharide biosynthesis C-terminal domain-containing protein, partial [Alistipes sp.]|nr:polysaccharide biosynthesis C-terminal domain-containing protein [Alistipes sp.]